MGFEKRVIIDGKVYEYMAKREMTDDEIKHYYDQVNKSGEGLFFFSLLRTIHIYIYIYYINATTPLIPDSCFGLTIKSNKSW